MRVRVEPIIAIREMSPPAAPRLACSKKEKFAPHYSFSFPVYTLVYNERSIMPIGRRSGRRRVWSSLASARARRVEVRIISCSHPLPEPTTLLPRLALSGTSCQPLHGCSSFVQEEYGVALLVHPVSGHRHNAQPVRLRSACDRAGVLSERSHRL